MANRVTTGDHLSPEFLQKNPFHKIPIIDDDGFILTEGSAILRYLTLKYKTPDHWYPREDLQQQARVDEYLHWHHDNVFRHEVAVVIEKLTAATGFGGLVPKRPINQEVMDASIKKLVEAIKHLDKYFLRDKPFIAGDDISVADLMAAGCLMQLRALDLENCLTDNPTVKAWIERVEQRLQPHIKPVVDSVGVMKQAATSS